jgi:hypothetical protein
MAKPDRNCGGELLARHLDSLVLHPEQMRNQVAVVQPRMPALEVTGREQDHRQPSLNRRRSRDV